MTRSTSGSYPTTTASTVFHRVNTKEVDGKLLYTIDGVVQSALRLMRGVMYIFLDEGYPENSFLFSTTPDGIHGAGQSYSDVGFYSIVDNKKRSRIQFVVPNDNTPNELFYYSQNRVNMGSAVQIYGAYPYGEAVATLTTNLGANLQSSISVTNSSSVY